MNKIIAFTATWCGPCKMLKPILQKLNNEGKINIEFIDIDENRELAIENKIKSVPTLIFFNEDNVEYDRLSGFVPENTILATYEV